MFDKEKEMHGWCLQTLKLEIRRKVEYSSLCIYIRNVHGKCMKKFAYIKAREWCNCCTKKKKKSSCVLSRVR